VYGNRKEIYYVIDLDGTTLHSSGDWTEAALVRENLRNLDRLRAIAKPSLAASKMNPPTLDLQRRGLLVPGMIKTGREARQVPKIKDLFAAEGIYFQSIEGRDWPIPTSEDFMEKYRRDRIAFLLLTHSNLQRLGIFLEVWEDDPVICGALAQHTIPHVQFQECSVIGAFKI
jgi:hypothetical protein